MIPRNLKVAKSQKDRMLNSILSFFFFFFVMGNDIFDEVIRALREDERFEEAIVELVERYFVDEQGGKHDEASK